MTTASNQVITSVDCDLRSDIQDELDWDPVVPSTSIGVSVTDHIVTLAGIVHTLAHRQAAVKAARRVKGVHAIVDAIVVVPVDSHGTSDQEIGFAVEQVLENTATLPTGLKGTVRDGVVTLTGSVEFRSQKGAAVRAVRDIDGIGWVQDDIVVNAQAADSVVR